MLTLNLSKQSVNFSVQMKRMAQSCKWMAHHLTILSTLSSNEQWHENSNNVVCATSKGSDQPAHTRRLISAFANPLNILWLKLQTGHHLEYLCINGGCTCSSESTLVKKPHCWTSRDGAQLWMTQWLSSQ